MPHHWDDLFRPNWMSSIGGQMDVFQPVCNGLIFVRYIIIVNGDEQNLQRKGIRAVAKIREHVDF